MARPSPDERLTQHSIGLVAGIAILVFLFFTIRSCNEAETKQEQAKASAPPNSPADQCRRSCAPRAVRSMHATDDFWQTLESCECEAAAVDGGP